MRKFILLSIIILVGCASINFNPQTGKASYTRIGDQHIQGLDIQKKKDGSYSLKLNNQQSQADALKELIQLLKDVKTIP